MTLQKHLYTRKLGHIQTKMDQSFNNAFSSIANIEQLYLPMDIPDDIQQFYAELGKPFFNSETKVQVDKLADLQMEIWQIHRTYKKLLILKSQKIGISSLCILITLWHALTDCVGMELIINAQSDDQAKTHAQDLRRIILGSDKYRDYLITSEYSRLGLLKDEVTKVHTVYLHNPRMPRLPTKIIVTGQSQGALLSHKRVGFIWSSDMTISQQTVETQKSVWGAMLSRLANSQGPLIVECPARAPEGPVYDTAERFEKTFGKVYDYFESWMKTKLRNKFDTKHDFYVQRFGYERGIEDGFFDEAFIEAEKKRLGPIFGTFYEANFFASQTTWYRKEHVSNVTDNATQVFNMFSPRDDPEIDVDISED